MLLEIFFWYSHYSHPWCVSACRAERNARFQKEKTQKKAEQEEARKAKLMEQQKSAVETEARRR